MSDPYSRAHLFDGQVLHSKIANFQLCDISDPLIKQHIDAPEGVRAECDKVTGWYDSDYLEQIRQLIRRKVAGLLTGRVISDAECSDLLGDPKADLDELAGKKKGGEKAATRSRSRSRSASTSSAGTQSGTDGEGGSEGGSGTEGSDAGTDDGTTGKKKARTRFANSRKSQTMPWKEKNIAKKARRAKARVETEEERVSLSSRLSTRLPLILSLLHLSPTFAHSLLALISLPALLVVHQGLRLRRALGVGGSGEGGPATSSSAGDWGRSGSEGPEDDEDDAMEE